MNFELERERLLQLATEADCATCGPVISKDAALIETVLKNAAVDIPEGAIFGGGFLHLSVMKEIVGARIEVLEKELRQKEELKPHFAA